MNEINLNKGICGVNKAGYVSGPSEEGLGVLDVLLSLAKHKSLIFCITLSFMVIMAIISLLLPKIYRAETTLLPPKSASIDGALVEAIAGGGSGGAWAALSGKSSGELYLGLLRGRGIADRILDRFDLQKKFKQKTREETRQILRGMMDVRLNDKAGIISLAILNEDPRIASDIANAYVEELKRLSSGLAISEASQRRLYFEEQLRTIQKRLDDSEESLRAFQERTGLQEVGAQTEAQVKALAELRAQVTAKEVQLGSLRSYATVANPEVRKLSAELAGFRSQLKRMEASRGTDRDPLNPKGGMPSVRLEYLQKLRDVKFNEMLYGLLLKQYETAKLGEESEPAVVQVIDRAEPPELRFKPRRTLMVLLAGALGLFASVFGALVLESMSRMKADPEEAAKLEELRSALRLRRRKA